MPEHTFPSPDVVSAFEAHMKERAEESIAKTIAPQIKRLENLEKKKTIVAFLEWCKEVKADAFCIGRAVGDSEKYFNELVDEYHEAQNEQ